ncbi:MAG: YfhO family protein [Lachnospiraceae bacterium]|nr:YfhO family protein [Lachnospiraceae bacterium]
MHMKSVSYNRKTGQYIIYTVLFTLIAGCLFGIFIFEGRTSIWYIDGLGQYYPSFLYTGSYIRRFFSGLFQGKPVLPGYDLSIGMGEDIKGCLNYYGFGNPINLLAAFANRENGGLFFAVSHVIRLYLAGFAAIVYLKEMGYEGKEASVGALSYAFCGFALYGGFMYIEFLSVLFYFPLMLAGAERLLNRRKSFKNALLFIFSVFYGALCGFYFLYMASLALLVYCVTRLFFIHYASGRNKSVRERTEAAGAETTETENAGTKEAGNEEGSYPAADDLNEKIPENINENDLSDTGSLKNPFKRPVRIREKNIVLIILTEGFKLLCFYITGIILASPVLFPVLYSFLNSERNPHAVDILSSRSNYLPRPGLLLQFLQASVIPGKSFAFGVLLIEWVSAVILFFLPSARRKLQLKIGVVISLAAVSLPITGYLFNGFNENYDRWVFLIHFLFMVVFVHVSSELKGRTSRLYGFLGLLVLNILFNIFSLFSGLGLNWQEEFVKAEGLSVYTDSPVTLSKTIEEDKGFFRISNDSLTGVNERPENVAMLNDYYGLTYWFSIINENTQKYVDEINGKELIWRSYGFNNNIYTEGLAGCRYYLSDTLSPDNGYEYAETVSFNGKDWYVYKNPRCLGMVYYNGGMEEYKEGFTTLEDYNRKFYEKAWSKEPIEASYDNLKNILSFETAHSEDAEVIVAIPYSAWWRAYLDAEEIPVSKFNMYMKLKVPAGSHSIKLQYK